MRVTAEVALPEMEQVHVVDRRLAALDLEQDQANSGLMTPSSTARPPRFRGARCNETQPRSIRALAKSAKELRHESIGKPEAVGAQLRHDGGGSFQHP